jgi:hypothetical protein
LYLRRLVPNLELTQLLSHPSSDVG